MWGMPGHLPRDMLCQPKHGRELTTIVKSVKYSTLVKMLRDFNGRGCCHFRADVSFRTHCYALRQE